MENKFEKFNQEPERGDIEAKESEQLILKEKEKYGHNVEISVIFARHAEYDKSTGKLTEAGKKQASEYGSKLSDMKIKGYSSARNRTLETLEEIKKKMESPEKYSSRTKPEFTIDMSEDDMNKYFGSIDNYLENKRIEEPSSEIPLAKEVAGFVARRINQYIKMSKRLKENSKVTLLNVCHMPHLISFLKEAIGNEIESNPIDPNGEKFTGKLGGLFKSTEDFKIKIVSQSKDLAETTINLSLRGREFILNMENLQKIASYSEEYEKRQKENLD